MVDLTEVCALREKNAANVKYHFKELHQQPSTNESPSLKVENLISCILRDCKLDPHTNTRKHERTHARRKGVSHLEGLEAEPDVVALGHSDPPHTLFGRSVVVGVVGRLNLSRVLGDLPPTDRCTRDRQTDRKTERHRKRQDELSVTPLTHNS